MKYYTERIICALCITTLFWSWTVNAQQVGMSATAHFKDGDTISTVTTFSNSAEKCELDVKRLIKERNSFGHELLARTDCVKSAAASDKQLKLLSDDLLLDRYSGFDFHGHIPQRPIQPIDICLVFPHLPFCSRIPPLPPICMLILCDFQSEIDKYVNPVHLDRIRVLLEKHRMDDYLKAEAELWRKHDMDRLGSRLQDIQQEMQSIERPRLDVNK